MQISLCLENTMYETEGKRLRDSIVGKLAFEKHYKKQNSEFFKQDAMNDFELIAKSTHLQIRVHS